MDRVAWPTTLGVPLPPAEATGAFAAEGGRAWVPGWDRVPPQGRTSEPGTVVLAPVAAPPAGRPRDIAGRALR